MNSYLKGLEGENLAADYLRKKGWIICERRFRGGAGEVDIIAREGDTFVFIEVKTWRSLTMDSLELSVNKRKQNRIVSAAKNYLYKNCLDSEKTAVRFDLIFISQDELKHIQCAWEEN